MKAVPEYTIDFLIDEIQALITNVQTEWRHVKSTANTTGTTLFPDRMDLISAGDKVRIGNLERTVGSINWENNTITLTTSVTVTTGQKIFMMPLKREKWADLEVYTNHVTTSGAPPQTLRLPVPSEFHDILPNGYRPPGQGVRERAVLARKKQDIRLFIIEVDPAKPVDNSEVVGDMLTAAPDQITLDGDTSNIALMHSYRVFRALPGWAYDIRVDGLVTTTDTTLGVMTWLAIQEQDAGPPESFNVSPLKWKIPMTGVGVLGDKVATHAFPIEGVGAFVPFVHFDHFSVASDSTVAKDVTVGVYHGNPPAGGRHAAKQVRFYIRRFPAERSAISGYSQNTGIGRVESSGDTLPATLARSFMETADY